MRYAQIYAVLLVLLAFGVGDLERGNRLYREGRYAEAVEAYRAALEAGAGSPVLHYNLGTALLRIGRYDEAEQHLRAALATIEPDARERTHFNLGSRFLEAGLGTQDPRARGNLLDAAIDAYKAALRINPADVDAKWNLELASREREAMPPSPQGGGGDADDQRARQEEQKDQNRGNGDDGRSAAPRSPMPEDDTDATRDTGAMSRAQADRLLSAVEQGERDLFREKLRKGRRDTPVARDW